MYSVFEILCKKKGITPADVSRATGIPQSTLSNWKSRQNLLSGRKAQVIADFFGVTVDYLMGRDDSNPSVLTAEESALLDSYNNADDATRDMVRRLLAYADELRGKA